MKKLVVVLLLFVSLSGVAREASPDSIRGSLRHQRTCYDVKHYDLKITIDPDSQYIWGDVSIRVEMKDTSTVLQIDLFDNYQLTLYHLYGFEVDSSNRLSYNRVKQALFFKTNKVLQKDSVYTISLGYKGSPPVAKQAPWDGGFVWSKDKKDRHFVGVACEGFGASSWWPCKDHLSDEPDSMDLSFTYPPGYQCISNGQFVSSNRFKDEVTSRWKLTYPINNYNVTFYLGVFKQLTDWYVSNGDSLKLDFYCLDYNEQKAAEQFKQVKPMLRIYEDLFGRFPFWNDGYKLVEAPYLGMEHQTAIAYGNKYRPGYLGRHPRGIDFDYIIIHESGHEYWGNSISMEDIADMWIHESFCTYTEALYVEKKYGYNAMLRYLDRQRLGIVNDRPILGKVDVNIEGSGDMYNKGAWILHTIRNLVNNDSIWFKTIRSFSEEFKYKTTNTKEVLAWWEAHLGRGYKKVFMYYLNSTNTPLLEYKIKKDGKVVARYAKGREGPFNINLTVPVNDNSKVLGTSQDWREMNCTEKEFLRLKHLFLLDVKKL